MVRPNLADRQGVSDDINIRYNDSKWRVRISLSFFGVRVGVEVRVEVMVEVRVEVGVEVRVRVEIFHCQIDIFPCLPSKSTEFVV